MFCDHIPWQDSSGLLRPNNLNNEVHCHNHHIADYKEKSPCPRNEVAIQWHKYDGGKEECHETNRADEQRRGEVKLVGLACLVYDV